MLKLLECNIAEFCKSFSPTFYLDVICKKGELKLTTPNGRKFVHFFHTAVAKKSPASVVDKNHSACSHF